MNSKNEPRILFFDIESGGINALKSDLGFCLMFGYKWSDEKKAHVITIDRKSLKEFDDSKLLRTASKLLEQADLLVGHFASVFDRRFIQGRLLINGLPPIPQTKLRDTCLIARSVANYSSNRLKHLAKVLQLGHQKLENDWPTAWFRMVQGDMKVLGEIAEYCKGDVLAVEDLYYKLRPFDNAHPRIIADRTKCGACGGEVQYRGTCFVGQLKYRRFQCTECARWDRERKAIADVVDPND